MKSEGNIKEYQKWLTFFKQTIDNLTEKPENRIVPLDIKKSVYLQETSNLGANTVSSTSFIPNHSNTPKC